MSGFGSTGDNLQRIESVLFEENGTVSKNIIERSSYGAIWSQDQNYYG